MWLGNFRGNQFGLKHKTLLLNSDKFWDFSLDEMAEHDSKYHTSLNDIKFCQW